MHAATGYDFVALYVGRRMGMKAGGGWEEECRAGGQI